MIASPEKIITPRQLELIALYASGYDYQQIGEMKFLSPYTVRNNLLRLSERIGTRNLTHLAVLCLDRGLIYKNGGINYKPYEAEGVVGE